ncbi:hypothetical protein CLOM_g16947 [Closterium sp. NIES-68]|nr:hypothetical protein CLOM_g16947 [Closterium sp. NIES-68]
MVGRSQPSSIFRLLLTITKRAAASDASSLTWGADVSQALKSRGLPLPSLDLAEALAEALSLCADSAARNALAPPASAGAAQAVREAAEGGRRREEKEREKEREKRRGEEEEEEGRVWQYVEHGMACHLVVPLHVVALLARSAIQHRWRRPSSFHRFLSLLSDAPPLLWAPSQWPPLPLFHSYLSSAISPPPPLLSPTRRHRSGGSTSGQTPRHSQGDRAGPEGGRGSLSDLVARFALWLASALLRAVLDDLSGRKLRSMAVNGEAGREDTGGEDGGGGVGLRSGGAAQAAGAGGAGEGMEHGGGGNGGGGNGGGGVGVGGGEGAAAMEVSGISDAAAHVPAAASDGDACTAAATIIKPATGGGGGGGAAAAGGGGSGVESVVDVSRWREAQWASVRENVLLALHVVATMLQHAQWRVCLLQVAPTHMPLMFHRFLSLASLTARLAAAVASSPPLSLQSQPPATPPPPPPLPPSLALPPSTLHLFPPSKPHSASLLLARALKVREGVRRARVGGRGGGGGRGGAGEWSKAGDAAGAGAGAGGGGAGNGEGIADGASGAVAAAHSMSSSRAGLQSSATTLLPLLLHSIETPASPSLSPPSAAAATARQQQQRQSSLLSPSAVLPSPSPWLALDLLLEAYVTSKRVPAAPTTIAGQSPSSSSSAGGGTGVGVLAPPLLVGCCWSDDGCRALPESIAEVLLTLKLLHGASWHECLLHLFLSLFRLVARSPSSASSIPAGLPSAPSPSAPSQDPAASAASVAAPAASVASVASATSAAAAAAAFPSSPPSSPLPFDLLDEDGRLSLCLCLGPMAVTSLLQLCAGGSAGGAGGGAGVRACVPQLAPACLPGGLAAGRVPRLCCCCRGLW